MMIRESALFFGPPCSFIVLKVPLNRNQWISHMAGSS